MTESASWVGDKLRRREEAQDLLLFLQGRVGERRRQGAVASYVLNVDSGWGHGKTYFLSNIQKDLSRDNRAVALVDAWATDFSDDPLTAIMSAIDAALRPHLKSTVLRTAWNGVLKSGGTLAISLAKHAGAKLLSKYAGDFGDELSDAVFEQDVHANGAPVDADGLGLEGATEEVVDKLADSALSRLMNAFRKQERSIITFKQQLARVAKSLNDGSDDEFKPIYVLVDELDRCRPTYALRLLESVKHLFETDGVVFIIATDTEQLSESVRAVYGDNFDSKKYLRRFFDRTYRFRTPDYESYIEYLFERSGIERGKIRCPNGTSLNGLASAIFRDFGASLRDAEQCIDMLHTFCTMWDQASKIELGYALPLICLYHAGRLADYRVVSGQSDEAHAPTFPHPSIILRQMTGGVYHERRYERTATTEDLVAGYVSATKRSLVQWLDQDMPDDLVGQHIIQIMREEFSTQHGNRYENGNPPYSILRTYHRYVELAERLSDVAAA